MNKIDTVEWGRLHYSSSPDRGLDNILEMLPWLTEKCPDVTLHIYYSFYNWSQAAKSRGDSRELKQIEAMQKQIDNYGAKVVMHGRVGQQELANEWKKAWCWFYPSSFTETFAITAVEAQLSATPIVCSNVGALQTTVGEYGIRVQHHPYSAEARKEYLAWLNLLYHSKDFWKKQSDKSFEGSKRGFSWRDAWDNHWAKLLG